MALRRFRRWAPLLRSSCGRYFLPWDRILRAAAIRSIRVSRQNRLSARRCYQTVACAQMSRPIQGPITWITWQKVVIRALSLMHSARGRSHHAGLALAADERKIRRAAVFAIDCGHFAARGDIFVRQLLAALAAPDLVVVVGAASLQFGLH